MWNKKTEILDLRFKGEKGMEGAGGMAERERRREAGRWKAPYWNRPPTNFGLKVAAFTSHVRMPCVRLAAGRRTLKMCCYRL